MVFSASDQLQNMHSMQEQSMVGRMVALSTGGGADSLAGGLMSRGMGAARPMASAVMGMAGLDPMSLGLRAGMGAWNAGAGVFGAGMVGMGALGAAGVVGAGASWAGGQMMTGAQQQLGLNQSLRQNFNHMNSQGGMGFTSNQGFQIGDAMRGMAGQAGAGGEFQTFGELSKLASNMGKMGMSQNVRTVAEFKENFKKMVDTLKTVAHDMGTSLEEAQKMMVSMKSSGIFHKADQLRMSGGMRSGGLATGLAMSEFSGAANIGSQISRSIGGLGRQGAMAGMKTMEQIGLAQRVGAISEEDIYNATGQTGAEGRQALAASQMQQSASFMQSGRGRRFLASIAGKNGNLNMDAVNEWMSGGDMSTGRTMELAHQNLAGVGRANFIRNEGRLRGAALEKFGGLAQSMVYKQWLSSRGHNPDEMDDRSMLAFQRFSGLGRDEADLAIKQVNAIPQMVTEMKASMRGQSHADQLTKQKNSSGIEGMKRQFELKKEHIQAKFQEAGARVLEFATNEVESWFNKTMGIYADISTEGLEQITRGMEKGGSGAKRQYERYFGKGMLRGGGDGGLAQIGKAMDLSNMKYAAMSGSSNAAMVAFGADNADFMKMASFGTIGKTPQEAIASVEKDLQKKAASDPKAAAALKQLQGASATEKAAMIQTMQEKGGVTSSALLSSSFAAQEGKMQYTASSSYSTMGDYEKSVGRSLAGLGADTDASRFKSAGLATKAVGLTVGWMGARMGMAALGVNKLFGTNYGGMTSLEAVGQKSEAAAESTAGDISRAWSSVTGSEEEIKGMGRAFGGKEMQGTLADLYSDDKDVANEAQGSVMNKVLGIQADAKSRGKAVEGAALGEMRALTAGALGAKYKDALSKDLSAPGNMDARNEIGEDYRRMMGGTADAKMDNAAIIEQLTRMRNVGKEKLSEQQNANILKERRRIAEAVKSDLSTAKETGYFDKDGKLRADYADARKKMSPEARAAAEMADKMLSFDITGENLSYTEKQAAYAEQLKTEGISVDAASKMSKEQQDAYRAQGQANYAHKAYYEQKGKSRESLSKVSLAERRVLAAQGVEGAAELNALESNLINSEKKGGTLGAFARSLGGNLSAEQLKQIEGNKGDTAEQRSARLLQKLDIKDSGLQKGIAEAMGGKTAVDRARMLDAALGNVSDPETRKKIVAGTTSDADKNTQLMKDMRDFSEKSTSYLKIIATTQNLASATMVKNAELPPKGK